MRSSRHHHLALNVRIQRQLKESIFPQGFFSLEKADHVNVFDAKTRVKLLRGQRLVDSKYFSAPAGERSTSCQRLRNIQKDSVLMVKVVKLALLKTE